MTSESRLLEYLFPQLLTSRHARVDYVWLALSVQWTQILYLSLLIQTLLPNVVTCIHNVMTLHV